MLRRHFKKINTTLIRLLCRGGKREYMILNYIIEDINNKHHDFHRVKYLRYLNGLWKIYSLFSGDFLNAYIPSPKTM